MITFDEIDADMIDFIRATTPGRLGPQKPCRVHVSSIDVGDVKRERDEPIRRAGDTDSSLALAPPLAKVYDLNNTGQGWNIYNAEAVHGTISMQISMNSIEVFSDAVQIIPVYDHWHITNPTRPGLLIDAPSSAMFFNQATWVPPIYPASLYVQVDVYSPNYGPMHGDLVSYDLWYKIKHTTRGGAFAEEIALVGANWAAQTDLSIAPGSYATVVV